MNRHEYEDLFLDYVEGKLPDEARVELERGLGDDAELRASLSAYRAIIAHEQTQAKREYVVDPGFTEKVMRRVETRGGFIERMYMLLAIDRKVVASLLATTAVAVLVVRIAYDSGSVSRIGMIESSVPAVSAPPADGKSDSKSVLNSARVNGVAPVSPGNRTVEVRSGSGVPSAPALTVESGKSSSSTLGSRPGSVSQYLDLSMGQSVQVFKKQTEPIDRREYTDSRVGSDFEALGFEGGWGRSFRQTFESSNHSFERYLGQPDSAPIMVSQEAASTFSIDVDTASYTNTRRFLQVGHLPPKGAVRTEEFINYFDYAYPVQHERPFTLSYELAPSPLQSGRVLLKLGIKARDIVDARKPWNLVFLVDTSGSMADMNKLPLVKQALRVLVDKMRPEDRVAIVTYAGSSEVKLGSTSGADKGSIGAVIESLYPGGGTYGSGGIQMAYSIAMANKAPGVNRVILVTDGDFNVGVTSREELVRMIEQHRQSGVALTTVGVGQGNLNDVLLEQLANKGDGNYFYLDSFREAQRIFEEKLVGTIETVAKDVKLQMEFNPKNVVQYKLVGYENRMLAKQDFNNDAVDAGEIGVGHTVTALYELVMAGSTGATALVDSSRYQAVAPQKPVETNGKFDAELGFLKIRFKAPEGQNSELLEFPVAMSDLRTDIAQTTPDFKFAAAIAGFAQSLRGALPTGVTLDQLISLAESGVGEDRRGDRREAIQLMKSAQALQKQTVAPPPAVVQPMER